ncbi:hypothetical protein [Nocardia alba]|uniref:Potassium/proton antiporter subunit KhtT-like N-terminal domain-containing protein n=1 Tax=Nocardia alba TaxID=225051 RepID=A0A4R1FVK3_9NOCA|nr:hypothetical protein [Nocardia alba]TCJ95341.1 hypothetical protein DFR71_4256 [Nocardia alba]
MDIDRTTIPGAGVLHSFLPRHGTRFALLTQSSGARRLLAYVGDSDEPTIDIELEPDEADQVAELMRSRTFGDRLARLEHRLDLLTDGKAHP